MSIDDEPEDDESTEEGGSGDEAPEDDEGKDGGSEQGAEGSPDEDGRDGTEEVDEAAEEAVGEGDGGEESSAPEAEAGGDDEAGLDEEPEPELPAVDADAFYSRDQWPDSTDEDWEEDTGDWTADDYQENAATFFGWREDFGKSSHDVLLEQGFTESVSSQALGQAVAEQFGPASTSIRMYEKDGAVVPRGFLNLETLASLALLYPLLDLSGVHVTVPSRSRDDDAPGAAPRPLPEALRNIAPADSVDLRKYCSPVGDQGQTSRCAAFAWTHGIEMLGNIQNKPVPPLSCSFTMLRFQQRQGDAKDFKWAWKGGDGTQGSWEPGKHIMETGTCRQELWPDDRKEPVAEVEALEGDARNYTVDADAYDISVDDMKRLLTAGLPVQLSIATGEAFQDIGPDGIMKVAEKPSGQHGYHAMLCVGYLGNYFIIKNSWGQDWGDQGYCYIPKKVLVDAEPEPVAIVPRKPKAPEPTTGAGAEAAPRSAPVRCKWCGSMAPPAASCAQCGGPLRLEHRCRKCQAVLPPAGVLCPACGTKNG